MAAGAECHFSLLALPDPCLLAVLQSCAATDQRSVFRAARAHPRLHQAAVLALRSISARACQQPTVDGMLLYLKKHGEHVDSIDLRGDYGAVLRELPPSMHLSSLQLEMLRLQLQRGAGFHGVLGAAATVAALKKLRLRSCQLHSGGWEAADGVLTAALSVLPAGLQHLSISNLTFDSRPLRLPTTVLQQLQQLTCLELANVELQGPDEASSALQPLQALTRLADLRLAGNAAVSITANMLSGTHHMTRMQLPATVCSNSFEPGALAGKTRLQHLDLALCRVPGGAAGVAQLLSHLQPLHQLTHLDLMRTLRDVSEDTPPAAAYAALTTSSKLQHLNISTNRLPAHVWQHMFPVDRQLLHLTSLDISAIRQPLDLAGGFAPAPEGSRLVSCCPSLQSLSLVCLQFEGLLPALQGLSTLHTLGVGAANCNAEHLLQLTQLKQLSTLKFRSPPYVDLTCRAPGDEPVWRQVAQHCLDHSNLEVAHQAAVALAQQ